MSVQNIFTISDKTILKFGIIGGFFLQMNIIPKPIQLLFLTIIFASIVHSVLAHHKAAKEILTFIPFYAFSIISIQWTTNSEYGYAFQSIATTLLLYIFVTQYYTQGKGINLEDILRALAIGGTFLNLIVVPMEFNLIGTSRLGGTLFGSPMVFSGRIFLSLCATLTLLVIKKKIIYVIYAIIAFSTCALSGSRTAIVFPILFFIALSIVSSTNAIVLIKKTAIIAILLVVSCFAIFEIKPLYDTVGIRMETLLTSKSDDASYLDRTLRKKMAIDAWKESPIYGHGMASFSSFYTYSLKITHSHCGYTEILVSYGIIGILLFYGPILLFSLKWKSNFINSNAIMPSIPCIMFLLLLLESSNIIFWDPVAMQIVAVFISGPKKQLG